MQPRPGAQGGMGDDKRRVSLEPAKDRRTSIGTGCRRRPSFRKSRYTEPDKDKKAASLSVTDAARRIQLIFRATRCMYHNFGPFIFTRKNGDSAPFGNVSFAGLPNTSTPFLIVSDTTSEMLLAQFMLKFWRVPMPEVVVSVSGSAQDLKLEPRLGRMVSHGLVSLATTANAVFVTGGLDAGVSKLVAGTLREAGVPATIIGVSTLQCVTNHKLLHQGTTGHGERERVVSVDGLGVFDGTQAHSSRLGGRTRRDRKSSMAPNSAPKPFSGSSPVYPTNMPNDQFSAALNPYHSHQIMVDTGWKRKVEHTSGPWATELNVRVHGMSCMGCRAVSPMLRAT